MRDNDRYDSESSSGRHGRQSQRNHTREYGDMRAETQQSNSRSQFQPYGEASSRSRENQGGGYGRADGSGEFNRSASSRGWNQRDSGEEGMSGGSFEDRGGDRTSRGFYGGDSSQFQDDRYGRSQYGRGQMNGGQSGPRAGGQGYRGPRADQGYGDQYSEARGDDRQGYGSSRSRGVGRSNDSYDDGRSGRGDMGRTYGSSDVDRYGSSGPGDWRDEYRDDRDSNWQNHYSRGRGGYTGASTGYGRTTEYEGETGATSRGHNYDYQGAASSRGYRENRGYQQDHFSSSEGESGSGYRMNSRHGGDDDPRGARRSGNDRSSGQSGHFNY